MRKLKFLMLGFLVLLFILWLVLSITLGNTLYGINENWFYWLELLYVIYFIWLTKLESTQILYIAFAVTLIGGTLSILGLSFSEQVLRASLAFWIIGIAIATKELKK